MYRYILSVNVSGGAERFAARVVFPCRFPAAFVTLLKLGHTDFRAARRSVGRSWIGPFHNDSGLVSRRLFQCRAYHDHWSCREKRYPNRGVPDRTRSRGQITDGGAAGGAEAQITSDIHDIIGFDRGKT